MARFVHFIEVTTADPQQRFRQIYINRDHVVMYRPGSVAGTTDLYLTERYPVVTVRDPHGVVGMKLGDPE